MKIFDLHCDTFCELFDRGLDFDNIETAVNIKELSQFETVIQTFAVFLHPNISDSFKRYINVMNYGKRCLEKMGIEVCRDSESLDGAGVKALLSVEGGVPEFDLNNIEMLHSDGVRTVSLTWNYDNPLGGGALGDGCLTELGRQTVDELNRFNMVTDLSHLNRKSFFEVAERSELIVATHSGVDKLHFHPRNLTDEQLNIIKNKSGLVGLSVYPEFIGKNPFEGFYRAIMHCLDLGLEDCLSLGTDFDGATMHESLSKISDLKLLYCFLVENGIENQMCDKIFFENSKEFYDRVLTNSKI